ncbi:DNA topoisomerase IA [Natronocella acetinitrilica]|uniref:DNA topoisomerase n=1 Tax=Natronocella acetinitrilica TaxID=414046 RepID=A0AAE3G302_9GAMM|nr:DNA topoisomerase [Natronocella acetinitrilica]MCP1674228.1 DNA topoisomerase IA [Natronocella acetinitrilica]
MTAVIITEKKDQAEHIAKALGMRLGRGQFEGTLEGRAARMLWARGHLLTLKGPEEVKEGLGWSDPKALRPIPRVFETRVAELPGAPASAQPKVYVDRIRQALRGASEVIIATDSDREGEAIGWEVLEHLDYQGRVRRAWLAEGLDKKSIQKAFSSLRGPEETKGWFRASEARARSDWAYIFPVRAYTYYASYSCLGPNLGRGQGRARVVSVGRVQAPALAMVVARDLEIEQFVAVDHYRVYGRFQLGDGEARAAYDPEVSDAQIAAAPPGVTWQPSKRVPKDEESEPLDTPLFTGEAEVAAFEARLRAAGAASRVVHYAERERSEDPPKTFELVDAQEAIARACGISASLAQTVLEDLYEQGWTSYARTAHSELPANLYEPAERNGMIAAVSALPALASQAATARAIHDGAHPDYRPFRPGVFSSKPMEHYGIVPTHQVMGEAAFAALKPAKSGTSGRIEHTAEHLREAYRLVAQRFIQALYPPARFAVQEARITVPCPDLLGHPESHFKARGQRLIDAGWRAAFGAGDSEDTTLPKAAEGAGCALIDVERESSKTSPPPRYTQLSFPKAMKNIGRNVRDPKLRKLLRDSQGLGTPATRSKIIETLIAREYVAVERGGKLVSQPKGRDLIRALPQWLASPETTAVWEDFLVKICAQKDDVQAIDMRDRFVEKQIAMIERHLEELETRHLNNLGPRQLTSSKVSKKMADFIRTLAERKGISVPRGTLSDPALARAFLDEHAPKRDPGDTGPSEGQRDFAQKIIASLPAGTEAPDDVLTDRAACKRFIDSHKDYLPPSEGMVRFARTLAERLPPEERPDIEAIVAHSGSCKAFLDKHAGAAKGKGGAGGKGAPRKGAPRKGGAGRPGAR